MEAREKQDKFAAKHFIRWLHDHGMKHEFPTSRPYKEVQFLSGGLYLSYINDDCHDYDEYPDEDATEEQWREIFDEAWRQYREHVKQELEAISGDADAD